VRGALETLLHALTTEDPGQEESGQVQAGKVNSELLAREPASIALLLSLLVCSQVASDGPHVVLKSSNITSLFHC
jgi:hypothetical protein